jgi:hypothetical protein
MSMMHERVTVYDEIAARFGRLFYAAATLSSCEAPFSSDTLRMIGNDSIDHIKAIWRILSYEESDLEEARVGASLDALHGIAPNWDPTVVDDNEG